MKSYLISFLIIIIVFFLTLSVMLVAIREFFVARMSEEIYKLVDSYSETASKMIEAEDIIENLLDNKLEASAKMVLNNRYKIDNSFLTELAETHFVDKIYWYSPDGEIINSKDGEYIGWKAYEGHPVHNFMNGEEEFLIEDIRKDTESNRSFKYGYLKVSDGYFVQVGVDAEHIYEMLSNFDIDSLVNELKLKNYIEDAYFTENVSTSGLNGFREVYKNHSAIAADDINTFGNNFEFKKDYLEKPYMTEMSHEIAFPIYRNNELIGYLNIVHSMSDTETTIMNVSIISAALIMCIFGVLSGVIIYMYKRKVDLLHLVYCDSLTGISNKKCLSEFLESKLEKSNGNKKALTLINISKFKNINSIFGYDSGDKVLLETVKRIKKILDGRCSLFRFSDDRFVIYIENYFEKEYLENLCKKIISVFDQEFEMLNISKKIDIRIGVLELEKKYIGIDQVMKDSSIAVESINPNEGSAYCFFNDSMEKKILRDEKIESAIKYALDKKNTESIYLEYQPQFDLKSERIIGFEALARMNIDELGYIPPLEFIRVAEERQLIINLGEQLIEQACSFLKDIENKGYEGIHMAVNLSAIQIMWDNLLPTVRRIIKKTGINPLNLEFEVTESIFDDNYDEINKVLGDFRSQGIRISIDDFGTGYSSLSKIRELHVDSLKIDKSFTDKILQHEESLIADIISLAHKLKLTVVVEGVEVEAQKEYLIKSDCDVVQGYLFGKSLSEEDALKILSIDCCL